jgi:hypothetical protein
LPVNSSLFGHYLTKKKPKSKNLKGKKKKVDKDVVGHFVGMTRREGIYKSKRPKDYKH